MVRQKCECDSIGWAHAKGHCPYRSGLQPFLRKGVLLWLCEDCSLSSDQKVGTASDEV